MDNKSITTTSLHVAIFCKFLQHGYFSSPHDFSRGALHRTTYRTAYRVPCCTVPGRAVLNLARLRYVIDIPKLNWNNCHCVAMFANSFIVPPLLLLLDQQHFRHDLSLSLSKQEDAWLTTCSCIASLTLHSVAASLHCWSRKMVAIDLATHSPKD